jgi:hypothetical protein
MIKHSKRYTYIQGKQLTDPGSGTRMYEISNYKLPSVTTVLGATKNQDFIKKWKAKVGEVEATRIKDHAFKSRDLHAQVSRALCSWN